MRPPVKIFALQMSHELGLEIAKGMGLSLSDLEERDFEDGEHKVRPLVSVRDADVYVVHSLHGEKSASVNDKLCRLLFFIGALRDSGAYRITAILPYLCYSRKDRKTKDRDPVTTRYVATMFEAVGTDRVVTMDVHNLQAFQNAFRCQTEHFQAQHLFADYLASQQAKEWVVMSPDTGGVKRASQFRDLLMERTGMPVGLAFMEKYRSMGILSGELMAGEVKDKHVIVIDDLVSSGHTLVRASRACVNRGATSVLAVVTHGVFSKEAESTLNDPSLTQLLVTNSISSLRVSEEFIRQKLVVIDIAPFLAEIITRLHSSRAVETLYKKEVELTTSG